MERHWDSELSELRREILCMGVKVESAISDSIAALMSLDADAASKVIEADRDIDELEVKLVRRCVDMLALYQPLAGDLRFITMAMQINTDLERMGDLAVNIAQCALELSDKPLLKPLIDIPQLAVIAREMTRDVIAAFLNSDVSAAKAVIARDASADILWDRVQAELIGDFMRVDPSTTTRALPLLMVARHLERICDHATNIAEDIIFMIEGKIIKHMVDEDSEER
jgi:phosphate transport system protein